jgi:hypothetical protein
LLLAAHHRGRDPRQHQPKKIGTTVPPTIEAQPPARVARRQRREQRR